MMLILMFYCTQVLAQCPSVIDEDNTDFIEVNDMPGGPWPGCTVLGFKITLVNTTENDLVGVTVTLTEASQPGGSLNVVDLGGFTFAGGVFSQTVTIPESESIELLITFQIDENFPVIGSNNVSGLLSVLVASGCTPETFNFDNIFPQQAKYVVSGTEFLDDIDTQTDPFEPGLLIPSLSDDWGQTIRIEDNGQLVIDVEEYHFPLGSTIMMGENASIMLANGDHTLVLSYQAQVIGCIEMWDKVEVGNGANLIMDGVSPSVLTPGVLIQDGINGVQLNDGATLRLKNTTFFNNNRSITTEADHNTRHFDFSISGVNYIDSDGNMKPPFAGKYPSHGMDLYGLNGVNIAGSGSGSGLNTIKFSNLSRGVVATRSTISLSKLFFGDIYDYDNSYIIPSQFNNWAGTAVRVRGLGQPRELKYTGFGGAYTDMTNCLAGIEADDMSTDIKGVTTSNVNYGITVRNSDGRTSIIKDNTLNVNTFGVGLYNNMPMRLDLWDNEINVDSPVPGNSAKGVGIRALENVTSAISLYRFWDNEINVDNGEKGIFFNSGRIPSIRNNTVNLLNEEREGYYGIDLVGTAAPRVRCNLVVGNGTTEDWLSAIGLNVTDISQGYLRCNDVQDTDIGINFQNLDDATVLAGNFINEHRLGLRIQSGASIGPQEHTGNQWLGFSVYGDDDAGPQGGKHGAYIESGSNPFLSQFYVYETRDNAFYPSFNTSNWFTDQNDNGNSFYCTTETSNQCPEGIGSYNDEEEPKAIDVLDYEIAAGALNDTLCEDAVNWTGQRRLYRRLLQDTALMIGDTLLEDFYDTYANTTVGEFAYIEADIIELMTVESTLQSYMDALGTTIDGKLAAVWTIDSTIIGGVSTGMRDTLLGYRTIHLGYLNTATVALDSLVDTLRAYRQALSLNLQSDNDNVTVTEVYEENEQIVNDIFLKTVAVDIDTFTTGQITNLEDIANQCPKCGGDAVYRARSLYALYDPYTEYDDVELCEPEPDPLIGPSTNVLFDDFVTYPNPATHSVTIGINPKMEEMERELQILTKEGKVLARSTIPEGVWKYQSNTNYLPAGTYFFTISENGRKIFTEKIIIIK